MRVFLIRSVACLVFGEEENNVPLNLRGPIGRPVDWHSSKDVDTRAQRVGVFNFGTDRVRVLEKIFRDGSGMDRVRVFASYI